MAMPRLKPIIAGNNAAARFALFWLLMLAVHVVHAQRQADNWCFGQHAWLSFGAGSPVASGSCAMNTFEGCSTISDAYGNLLFYSDGVSVWNRNHVVMLNGGGLMGNFSATQSSIIVPKPSSDHLYYLFTVPAGLNYGLRYSLVDMNLDFGLGGVVESEKNILLQPNVAEKVTAVKHANNADFWVITHELNNDIYDAFLISPSGISPVPVKSTIGVNISNLGYLKSSPDGSLLANANYDAHCCELFNFNNNTGILSNPIKFTQNISFPYGIEFSPNSQLLYFGNLNLGKLFQVSLASGDSAQIVASQTEIAMLGTNLGALQLGKDGKIYIAFAAANYLHEISNPDVPGTGCGFHANTVYLGGNFSNLGLPTFIQSYFNPVLFTYKNVCFGDTTEFTPEQTTGYDSLLWNFGDPASAPFDTSGLTNPTHIFTAPGTYTVSLTTWSGGNSAVMTQEVKINPLPQPNLGADTTLCGGGALVLALGDTYTEYLWSDGSTGKTLIVTTTGTYTVTVTDGNGCEGSDGIQVAFHAVPGAILIKHN